MRIGVLIGRSAILFAILLSSCYPRAWNRADPTLFDTRTFPFVTGPYLVRMAPDRVAVVIKDPFDEPPVIEHWLASEVGTSTIVPEKNPRFAADTSSSAALSPAMKRTPAESVDGLWVAVLEDLPPDRRIEYRVRTRSGITGPFQFRAHVSRGKPFRFAAFGDTRTGHQVHRLLVEAIDREQVDFVINSGDLVEFGGVDEQWDNFFRIEAPLIAHKILFPVVGNHDDSPRALFQRFFLSRLWAESRRYYAQDWGDVRVVVLDSQIEMRSGSLQYAFAEAALKEGAKAGQLLIMSLHYPPFSSGEHGSYLEVREVVQDLARRFGVEVVLAGHDHDYERTKIIEGTTYIVAASAGATIRRITPADFSLVLRTEPHFVIFDVERGGLLGRAINLSGNTFDSFAIAPNPPRERLE
jgi:Icc-related predicted phosphoesterase